MSFPMNAMRVGIMTTAILCASAAKAAGDGTMKDDEIPVAAAETGTPADVIQDVLDWSARAFTGTPVTCGPARIELDVVRLK